MAKKKANRIDRSKFVILYYFAGSDSVECSGIRRSLRSSMDALEIQGFEPSEYEEGKKLHRRYVRGSSRAEIVYFDEWFKGVYGGISKQ